MYKCSVAWTKDDRLDKLQCILYYYNIIPAKNITISILLQNYSEIASYIILCHDLNFETSVTINLNTAGQKYEWSKSGHEQQIKLSS